MIIVAAKIQFSDANGLQTLGAASGPYFQSTAGLVNRTWYPILDPDVSFDIEAMLPWESGAPADSFGTIELINGRDGIDDHILDRFLTAQIEGLQVEVRRGEDDQVWEDLEHWTTSHTATKDFRGENLVLAQRSALDVMDKPLSDQVFADDTPNPRLVNQTAPLMLGLCFQIQSLVWDAPNQIYYTAMNLGAIIDTYEGGALTQNWQPVSFGHQMTAGTNLTITVDAIGPPPDTASATNVLTWNFDAWTADDPDGITVFESDPDALISESAAGTSADIALTGNPDSATAFVSFTSPFLTSPWGVADAGDWAASSGTVPDAIVADDGVFAEVSIWGSSPVLIVGVDPALPDDSKVVGVELEVIAEGTNAQWEGLSVIDKDGFQISAFAGVSGGISRTIPDTKTTTSGGGGTFKTSVATFDTARVNAGIGVYMSVRQNSPSSVATAKVHQVRIKLHYTTAVDTVRLYSTTAVLTAGNRYRVDLRAIDADVFARWAGVAASGDAITPADEPGSTHSANLQGSGDRSFEFVAEGGFFGIEFVRSTSGGTAEIDRIRVAEISQGLDRYPGLVAYMAGLMGISDKVDTAAIQAHADATGNPQLGWYVTGSESMAEIMSLFAASLGGTWWRDRDAKIRSRLWHLDPEATPVVSFTDMEIDGIRRDTVIRQPVRITTHQAPNATARAQGARNWHVTNPDNAAGITDEFTEQDRAAIFEEFRVIRRANFDNLNPWTN